MGKARLLVVEDDIDIGNVVIVLGSVGLASLGLVLAITHWIRCTTCPARGARDR